MDAFEEMFKDEESLQKALKEGFHVGDFMFIESKGLDDVKEGDEFRIGPFVGVCLYKGSCVTTMRMLGQFRSWEEWKAYATKTN